LEATDPAVGSYRFFSKQNTRKSGLCPEQVCPQILPVDADGIPVFLRQRRIKPKQGLGRA